jgi:two-component system, OmpR family, response regulator
LTRGETNVDKAHIVVVDDEPFIIDIISWTLKLAGYTVSCASNGVEGLALVKYEQPEVLIIDLLMPELNGAEVIKRLRADGNALYIILTTANPIDLQAAFLLGSNNLLLKPFPLKELLRQVEMRPQRTHLPG